MTKSTKRASQLPALRRHEFLGALEQLDVLTPAAVMAAFDAHIEVNAVRLGSLCDAPGCDLLLTNTERPLDASTTRHVTECAVHGVRTAGVFRLAVAFAPRTPAVPQPAVAPSPCIRCGPPYGFGCSHAPATRPMAAAHPAQTASSGGGS